MAVEGVSRTEGTIQEDLFGLSFPGIVLRRDVQIRIREEDSDGYAYYYWRTQKKDFFFPERTTLNGLLLSSALLKGTFVSSYSQAIIEPKQFTLNGDSFDKDGVTYSFKNGQPNMLYTRYDRRLRYLLLTDGDLTAIARQREDILLPLDTKPRIVGPLHTKKMTESSFSRFIESTSVFEAMDTRASLFGGVLVLSLIFFSIPLIGKLDMPNTAKAFFYKFGCAVFPIPVFLLTGYALPNVYVSPIIALPLLLTAYPFLIYYYRLGVYKPEKFERAMSQQVAT